MRFGDTTGSDEALGERPSSFRPYLLVSLALHAALGGWLYWSGAYQVELRRQEEQVASSMRATSAARTARRVEDLHRIKQLMEASAKRQDRGGDAGDTADAADTGDSKPAAPPASSDPRTLLEQARTLAKEIDAIDRAIKADELAELTGMSKEEARADIDADASPQTPPEGEAATAADAPNPAGPAHPADPAAEIAKLESEARQVLAKRADALQRKRDGVAVGGGLAPSGGAGTGGNIGASGLGQGGPTVASAQMQAFLRERQAVTQNIVSRRYGAGSYDIFDDGGGQIPAVRFGQMVKGSGRMLGAGGQFANRVYLNNWYLIGPFQGQHGRGIFNNPRYPPEDAVLLDAVYHGKEQRLLRWEYVRAASYPLIPRDAAEDAVYYGYTEVLMDQERDLLAWIGADDDAQVYVNDQLVWRGGNTQKQGFFVGVYDIANTHVRDYNRTEGQVLVRFKKGRNKVFFKLSNGPTRVFFSMVLTMPGQH